MSEKKIVSVDMTQKVKLFTNKISINADVTHTN